MKSQPQKIVEALHSLIERILVSLAELHPQTFIADDDFILGQTYAYVEYLELLQNRVNPAEFGIDFDIEKRFPLG